MTAMDFPASPTDGQTTPDGRYYFDAGVGGNGAWRSVPLPVGGLPAGSIIQWGASAPPANWLLCDGSAVSRSGYPSLFAAIGTTYGSGDGSTTFNVPNLKGRVPVGRDGAQTEFDTLGESGGAKTHTLTTAEMPSHNHSAAQTGQTFSPAGNDGYVASAAAGTGRGLNGSQWGIAIGNTGGGQAHNNLQPYLVTNYIIKATAGWTAGDSELSLRVGAVEARKLSGLIPIIPVSVTVAGGTASAAADGAVTFTSATSVSLNNVFSSEYANYMLKFSLSATGTFEVRMRMRTNGSDRTTTGYSVAGTRITDGNVGANMASAGLNGSPFLEALSNGVNYHTSTIQMFDPFVASKPVNWSYHSTGVNNNQWGNYTGSGRWGTAESNDGFTFYPTGTGNITGTVQVFAYE